MATRRSILRRARRVPAPKKVQIHERERHHDEGGATMGTHTVQRVRARIAAANVTSVIQPMGWLLIAIAVLGWGIGLYYDWAEFFVCAMAATVLLIVAGVCAFGGRNPHATIVVNQPRVQISQKARGSILFRGNGTHSTSANITMPVGSETVSFRVKGLQKDSSYKQDFRIPTHHRAVVKIGPVYSVQGDPLGAIARESYVADAVEVYVHPHAVMLDADAIGFLKDVEGVVTAKLSSSDVSFHALREYQPGDDRRSIHWRTTARTGKLMVRQFEETMRAHLLIVLSTLESDYDSPEDFELAVSIVASLGISAFGEERQVTVCTSAGPLSFVSAMTMLDALCAIELQATGDSLAEVVAGAVNDETGISVAALVSGNTELMDMRGASLKIPVHVRTFAVRAQSQARTERQAVGDLVVVNLADLSHLPAAMRSVL